MWPLVHSKPHWIPYRVVAIAFRVMMIATCLSLQVSCSIFDSKAIVSNTHDECRSSLGAYYLPKKVITVSVADVANSRPKQRTISISEPTAIPDRSQPFCLDYLESWSSIDTIAVDRDNSSGYSLLKRVYSKADDRSKDIALKVLEIARIGATGDPTIRLRAATEIEGVNLTELTFDPFDRGEAALVNVRLAELGYCVFVHGGTFDVDIPPEIYCSDPARYSLFQSKRALGYAARGPVPLEVARRGIVYRPNLTHELVVMRRPEPNLRHGQWSRERVLQIEIPNGAPAFLVEVPRSLFVERKTDVQFNNGTLTNITVLKPSELASFVDIPLSIAQAIVSIPNQRIQVRINDLNNRENLIRAQAALIQEQRNLNDLLQSNASADLPNGKGSTTSSAVETSAGLVCETDKCKTEVTACAKTTADVKPCYDKYKASNP